MTARRALITGIAAVAVVAIAVGGMGWLSQSLRGSAVTGSVNQDVEPPGADHTADPDEERREAERLAQERESAMAERVLQEFLQQVRATRHGDAFGVALHADVCGDAVAVTVERAAPQSGLLYLFGRVGVDSFMLGETDVAEPPELAALKAEAGASCRRVVPLAAKGELLAAVMAGAGVPDNVTLLDAELVAEDLAVAVVEGTLSLGQLQRWIGVLAMGPEGWTTAPDEWVGTNIPANHGLTRYSLRSMGLAVDPALLVGAAPEGAAELEIAFGATLYRYGVDQGSPGIVIVPPDFDELADFRWIDANGRELGRGTISP